MAADKKTAAALDGWICFEDEAGQILRPPRGRTWARRGHTPVATVSGKGSGRVSITGMICLKAGHRSRMIYRVRLHRGRKGERRSFAERDYAALLDAAHQQLGGSIVLVWDNLNTHLSHAMRSYIAARDWLTVYRLPAYAFELNPVEGIWASMKHGLGNLLVDGLDALNATIKTRLKRMQYRPDLIDGFFAETGLALEPT
ncbi:transposase [Streptosporangium sp. NPDC020072]|uniref:transposase n=1 Tax=Streptosporangium sp. NPDC020072 TaxID=3154788 RepID=UPI003431E7E0